MDGFGLTPRQRQVMLFVQSFIDKHGFSPTLQQITDAMGLKSKGSAHRIIACLCERGYVKKLPYRANAVTVVERIKPAKGMAT